LDGFLYFSFCERHYYLFRKEIFYETKIQIEALFYVQQIKENQWYEADLIKMLRKKEKKQ